MGENPPHISADQEKQEVLSKIQEMDKWEEVGAHRPIGQLWYSIGITLIAVILSFGFLALIVSVVYPYPEIKGYFKIADTFFLLVFQIFDMGTAFSVDRFIGEWRVKDQNKMIKYMQFFFWYQMMTGLVQILIISFAVFYWMRYTELAYLSWIFLIIVAKQWPCISTSLKNSLEGLQRFDKATIMEFLLADVIKDFMAVGLILIGRWYGRANPQIGELFGATLGLAFGGYLVEFIAILIGGRFFSQAMKPFGYTIKDAFKVTFDWPIVKECFWYGFQVSIIPSINTLTTTWMLIMYVNALPQYTSYIFIAEIAKGIASIVSAGSMFKLTPSIAESYPNGKVSLALYYIQTNIKWAGFFMMLFLGILAGFVLALLKRLTLIPGLENYAASVDFLPFFIIQSLFMFFISLPDPILLGTLRVSFYTFVRLVEEILQVFFVWFFLYVLRLHETMGITGIGIILGFEHFFPRLIKMAMCYIYLNKSVFKIKVYWVQSLVIPFVSVLPELAIARLWDLYVIDFLIDVIGLYFGVALTLVIGILVFPLLTYLPLTGILGGWDDKQLEIFKKSITLSGPSKWLVKPFYHMVLFWAKKSPWHNKFRIPWEEADQQVHELHLMKLNQSFVAADVGNRETQVMDWFNKRKNKSKNSSEE